MYKRQSLWGTQQSNLRGEGKFDGVFGIWYGKGPGVDRAGDALKHVNLAGTSKYGGVLALMGDDHICESSTTSHQSEFAMIDAMIPFFNPSGVQEILDYGLYGIQLSRQSGCWVGIKCVHDNVSSGATVDLDENRFIIKEVSNDFYPDEGLNIRLQDTAQTKEHRLHALRFLVFYEELFLGKKQPLDSPSDKLASVLNRNLSDPEVKEAYKKALDYIPQR